MEPFQLETGNGSLDCLLTLEVATPAGIVVQLAAARRLGLWQRDRLEVLNNGAPLTAHEIVDDDHTRQHVIRAEPGILTVSYQAAVARTGPVKPPVATEAQCVTALRPSRYCPCDLMAGFAQSHFGGLPGPMAQVQAICTYVWEHIGYEATTSGPTTDAVQTLLSGRGVCRDFAHLVATLCRAVDVPARMASVYAPGLSPMDFHAVVETAIDGSWWVWDATRLAPRQTLVRIGTGRDAADVAFATVISGRADLTGIQIGAVAATDLPLDDHAQLVALG